MIEKRQKQRMESWGRVNKLLEAKKAPPTFFDSMALARNTPTKWLMVGLLFEAVRLYGWE